MRQSKTNTVVQQTQRFPRLRRRSVLMSRVGGLLGLGVALAGCSGSAGDPAVGAPSAIDPDMPGVAASGAPQTGSPEAPEPANIPGVTEGAVVKRGATGITRLSRAEYSATVSELLAGIAPTGADMALLPPDSFSPFDNGYELQTPSNVLIQGLGAVAESLVDRLLADPVATAQVIGCTPSGAADAECFRQFLVSFGTRALRRPLDEASVAEFMPLLAFSEERGDFSVAVGLAIRIFLQDMEFLYRSEIGTAVPGAPNTVKLNDYELGSRLSFLLAGKAPSEELMQLSATGALQTPVGLRDAAETLLDSEAGIQRLQRFHAMWMGYEASPHSPELSAAFRQETDALVQRVIYEQQGSILDLLTAKETFLTPELAEHYGLPAPAGESGWVPYGEGLRAGILSHGSLLSHGAQGEETSISARGKFILERMMCSVVPPPPENIVTELPEEVEGANCKKDKLAAHTQGPCVGCHKLIDGIGYGLENFDSQGRYRSTEPEHEECTIDGVGEQALLGQFTGPGELGLRVAESGLFTSCAVEQFYQFALGRATRSVDSDTLGLLESELVAREGNLREFILDWVSDESFRYRKIDDENLAEPPAESAGE